MYPDLSYLFHDIFGSSVDNWASVFKTFGLLLATALFTTYVLLRSEFKRLERMNVLSPNQVTYIVKEGIDWKELIYNSLVVGFIGLKLPYIINNFPDFQADPAGVLFSLKGNFLVGIGMAVIVGAYSYFAQLKSDKKPGVYTTEQYPHERAGDIIIVAGLSGVLGAKLFSILENVPAFLKDPFGQLISGNGLNILGGLILAFFVVYFYTKKLNIKPIYLMDIAGMGILLGYAVGRIGCQLSGDGDWGIVAAAQPEWWFLPDWLWSYHFPNNVNNAGGLMDFVDQEAFNATLSDRTMSIEQRCDIASGMRYCHELKEGVYPTSVYETLISLSMFGLLWVLNRKLRIAGIIFFLYMIINGIERWLMETIRVNDKYEYLGLNWSQAQYISIIFILIGVVGCGYIWKNKERFRY